jgi:hypothetical protein
MIRKSLLALAAVATVGAAALAPTTASAGWKGWHGWHGHIHIAKPYWGYGPHYVGYGYGYDCFWKKKKTPWGKKLVKVCY